MIPRHMTLHDLHVRFTTHLPNQLTYSKPNLTTQNPFPILRRPYQVQMNLENRVRTVAITHDNSDYPMAKPLLKLSP